MAFPFLEDFFKDLLGLNVPLPIPTFGTFVAVAFLVCLWLLRKEVERKEALGIFSKIEVKSKNGELRQVPVHALVDQFGFVGMAMGMVGARLFHILERPEQFLEDPWGMIFSRGGLTILGGLIVGAMAGTIFLKRKKIPVLPFLDAGAPGLILAYGIGRIGCQLSGDGDWGIAANMALKPDWLPKWLWASTYEGNVLGVHIPEPGVYPTPIYETLAAFLIFGILWKLRRHSHRAGWLFSLYLVLSGIQRFFTEWIRVNATYDIFGLQITQAEILSTAFILLGCWGLLRLRPSARIKT